MCVVGFLICEEKASYKTNLIQVSFSGLGSGEQSLPCKLMCALESRLANPAAFAEGFKTTPLRGPQAHRNKYASFSSPYSIPYSIFCFNHSCSTLCPHERLDSSTCMKEGIHENSNKSQGLSSDPHAWLVRHIFQMTQKEGRVVYTPKSQHL